MPHYVHGMADNFVCLQFGSFRQHWSKHTKFYRLIPPSCIGSTENKTIWECSTKSTQSVARLGRDQIQPSSHSSPTGRPFVSRIWQRCSKSFQLWHQRPLFASFFYNSQLGVLVTGTPIYLWPWVGQFRDLISNLTAQLAKNTKNNSFNSYGDHLIANVHIIALSERFGE